MDRLSEKQRRHAMRSVRSANTGPELIVRRRLHAAGYRYRLHVGALPGKPDIVFPSRRKIIFVHGCFWHSHHCAQGEPPATRRDYWLPKLARNRERDARNLEALRAGGWEPMVIWECECRRLEAAWPAIVAFLDGQVEA